jgi:hypothetical protein
MWWRRPKVSFVSMVDGVAEAMPIVRSGSVKREWAARARADAASERPPAHQRFEHLARCSGINAITSRGWVQRAWQDIAIYPQPDGNFEWQTPLSQKSLCNDISVAEYVGFHANTYAQAIGDKSVLSQIVKIQSPWVAYIPRGYSLLVLPFSYPDATNYEASPGILDSAGGLPIHLSVQLVWRELNAPSLIPAGAPLCQYFLVKTGQFDAAVRSATDADRAAYKAAMIASRSRFTNIPNCARLTDKKRGKQ